MEASFERNTSARDCTSGIRLRKTADDGRGKMKSYRKPPATAVFSSNNHAPPTVPVSLTKPRNCSERHSNVYASCFPEASLAERNHQNLLTSSDDIRTNSAINSSSTSTLVPFSPSGSSCTRHSALRRSSRNQRRHHSSSGGGVDNLEALSIDALYDKIRGNVKPQICSTTERTESSFSGANKLHENSKEDKIWTNNNRAITGSDNTRNGEDVDEIYFDISALNIATPGERRRPKNNLGSPTDRHDTSKNATGDPWQPCFLPKLLSPPFLHHQQPPLLPNVFFSFDDTDLYSLHSLPLRSPALPQQGTANNSHQRRQPRSSSGTRKNDQLAAPCSQLQPLISYRKSCQHRPLTATTSSTSTQPLLTPAVHPTVQIVPTKPLANNSITCSRCHKCRCAACREPLQRIGRAGRFARDCLEFGTCMWCARQCMISDNEDDDENHHTGTKRSRRSASCNRADRVEPTRRGFFGRRVKLALMSLVCPCLCLHRPLKAGGSMCGTLCKRVVAHSACLCGSTTTDQHNPNQQKPAPVDKVETNAAEPIKQFTSDARNPSVHNPVSMKAGSSSTASMSSSSASDFDFLPSSFLGASSLSCSS